MNDNRVRSRSLGKKMTRYPALPSREDRSRRLRLRGERFDREEDTQRGNAFWEDGSGPREQEFGRRRYGAVSASKEVVTRCSAAADLIARNEHSERVRHGSFTLPDAATRPKVIFVHEHRPKPPTLSRMQISHKKTLLLL
ncbi:uncharacterized protein LOC143266018 isoform X4 [Megachile rotundata]|uniref:uncharacterized protein LOC143266018 isoform X4 n=1 Tax=Megachile rotundata TaxID=143995 RepID=UPI003FD32A70